LKGKDKAGKNISFLFGRDDKMCYLCHPKKIKSTAKAVLK